MCENASRAFLEPCSCMSQSSVRSCVQQRSNHVKTSGMGQQRHNSPDKCFSQLSAAGLLQKFRLAGTLATNLSHVILSLSDLRGAKMTLGTASSVPSNSEPNELGLKTLRITSSHTCLQQACRSGFHMLHWTVTEKRVSQTLNEYK